ncbi:MAG: hypothetical protein LBE64_10310 [Acinetobacter pittii]|nr:hypothetical protein [Acinetobacter pittii]
MEKDVDEGKEKKEKKRKDATKATDAAKNWRKKNSINEISESFTADVLPRVTASVSLGPRDDYRASRKGSIVISFAFILSYRS